MALAKRNEAANVTSDINVTPMVDVMLVLLIIFMVVTPMLQHGKQVDMAQVNNPTDMHDADKETVFEPIAQVMSELGRAKFKVNVVTQPEDAADKRRK